LDAAITGINLKSRAIGDREHVLKDRADDRWIGEGLDSSERLHHVQFGGVSVIALHRDANRCCGQQVINIHHLRAGFDLINFYFSESH
jgi:hypothetical protein